MALKRIYIPTIMLTPTHLRQWAKQGDPEAQTSLDKTSTEFNARILSAEQDLNIAFTEGYEIKTQYDVKAQWEEGITFILYKFDFEEANRKAMTDAGYDYNTGLRLPDTVGTVSPISEIDMESIAAAWSQVDLECAIDAPIPTDKQLDTLRSLARTVERMLFPKQTPQTDAL